MAIQIISCNVVSDSPFVKVNLSQYTEKYMPFGFDAYLDLREEKVQIKSIQQRSAPNEKTVSICTVFGDSFIARKTSTVYMTKYDLKQAKQAVKDKKKAEKYILKFGTIQEKVDVLTVEGEQTLTDYCYEMYEKWLLEWQSNPHPTSAARTNQWRERFLQFASVSSI